MIEEGVGESRPRAGFKVAIAVFPLLLVISVIGAVWFHWRSGEEELVDPRLAMHAGPQDQRELAEHMEKLTLYVQSRGWESEEGRRGLRQTIAYIGGTLSPQNYGFRVERSNALSYLGELWPILWVDVEKGNPESWVLVEVSYDGDPADVALALAAIDRLRTASLDRGVRFLFVPRHAPGEARRIPLEPAAGLKAGGWVDLEGLLGENLRFRLGGEQVTEPELPAGDFELSVTGEGQVLDERLQVDRARWLAGFLRSTANRR